jgi:hypothetical protein
MNMRAIWKRLRWLIALAAIGFWLWVLADHASMEPMTHGIPFEYWYGNWEDVLLVSAASWHSFWAWPGRADARSGATPACMRRS